MTPSTERIRRYCMIGAPVTTVRTPALLEAYLAEHGIPAQVETRHVEPADLARAIADIRADPDLAGLCVTMPHKRAIVPLLDGLEATAAATESVNAVRRVADGRLVGAQFDGIGLVGALLAAGCGVTGKRVLLAGLGGAGLAIAEALRAENPACLVALETDPARRAKVSTLWGLPASMPAGHHPSMAIVAPEAIRGGKSDAVDAISTAAPTADWLHEPADILVNATPLGMQPDDPSPFNRTQIAAADCVADIVADPPKTALAAMAEALEVSLVTGRDVVAAQVGPIGDWLAAAR